MVAVGWIPRVEPGQVDDALKALAANLAVDGAESLLAKQLNPQAQEALISSFVKSLEGRPN